MDVQLKCTWHWRRRSQVPHTQMPLVLTLTADAPGGPAGALPPVRGAPVDLHRPEHRPPAAAARSARSAGREILRGCRPSAQRAPARGPHRHTRTAPASPGVPPLCSVFSISSVSSALIPVAQMGTGEGTPSNYGWITPVGEMGIFSPAAVPRRPRLPRLRVCPPVCLRTHVSAPPPAACRCLHSAVSFGCCGFAGGKTGLFRERYGRWAVGKVHGRLCLAFLSMQ